MRVGIPNAGQLNALETLNIRGERSVTCKGAFDAHAVVGSAAGRRAGGVRNLPQAAGRPGARRRARCHIRHQPRPRGLADVLHHGGREGPVRHPGHADHRQQRRGVCDGRAAGRRHGGGPAAREGRDHLREVGRARVQRRSRRSRRARFSPHQHGGRRAGDQRVERPGLQSVRHRARAAWLEQRVGRGHLRQPRHRRHLRTVRRVVPGPRVPQRHRHAADDEGRDARQRRHRQPVVQRSRRRPRAHAGRRRPGARRDQGPDAGYYDSRDPFTAIPPALVPAEPYASFVLGATRWRRTRSRCRACAWPSCASTWSRTRSTTRRSPTRSIARSSRCCATGSAPSSSRPSRRPIRTIPACPTCSTPSPTRFPSCCRG